MKKLLLTIAIILVFHTLGAQVNVYDCTAYTEHLTQAEINAAQDHFGACITLGGNNSIHVSGNDHKTVHGARQIHLKENFHAGSFDETGQLHLKISERSDIDLAVMNYPDLNGILRYKKFELGVKLPAGISERVDHFLLQEGVYQDELNPFLEWELDVEATFYHAASGTSKTVDGYYHREYIENPVTDDWDDIGTDHPFRIRYAPPRNGKWIAKVSVKINGEAAYDSEWFGFKVVESGDPGYVYVHPNRKNLMRGNNMIFPVGHNFPGPDDHSIPWAGMDDTSYIGNNLFTPQTTNKAANTKEWDFFLAKVESYFQQGGRYIRNIQSPWSSLIEFEKKGNYYDRLHYAWEQDKFLDLCEQYDALMMFNLQMHTVFEKFSGYSLTFWDWGKMKQVPDPLDPTGFIAVFDPEDPYPAYCYNDSTNGLNKLPHEALINEDDLKYHGQRTRYYIARYGYSTKIYEFELLSEPFNVNGNAATGEKPYEANNTPEQQTVFDAVYTYQGRLSWFIKEKMGHTEHLIGVDYSMSWEPDPNDIYLDQSMHHGNVDIIGVNYYNRAHNKYIMSKSGSNNTFHNNENSRARAIRDFQSWANKPVILSEFGDGDDIHECSNYIGSYVDVMSAGFIGVCGFNLWEGKAASQNFLWPATIRAQYHMNGTDVISTLSNGNGGWIQGRQHERVYRQHNADAKELQYYISSDKEKSVGYIRNRTYNVHTKRINETCNLNEIFNGNNIPVDNLTNIAWNDGPVGKRLKIQGLKNNTDYQIDWYSFKEGNYLFSECRSTGWLSNSLVLRFPTLTVTPGHTEQAVVWFVVRQQNCQQGMMPPEGDEALNLDEDYQLRAREETEEEELALQSNSLKQVLIYPNPFEDFFVISSINEDVLLLHAIDGTQVGSYIISQGETKITTSHLSKGIYIVSLQQQGQQFKIIKQ